MRFMVPLAFVALSACQTTSETDVAGWTGKFGPGRASVRVTCAGPGSVRVTARWLAVDARAVNPGTGPVVAERTLRCAAVATAIEVPLALPATGWVGVELRPDASARNRAGFAVAVDLE